MKRLLFTIKLISFMLFIFMLFSSIFITNTVILKYFITTTSLVILIFLIYTLYKNDIYLYKSLDNSLSNLIIYKKNNKTSSCFNKNKGILFLLKQDEVFIKLFFSFSTYIFLDFILFLYEFSIAKTVKNLNNTSIVYSFFICLILINCFLLMIKIFTIFIFFIYSEFYDLAKHVKKENCVNSFKFLLSKYYKKTCKINIVIYILFILELILCLYIIS